MKKRVFGRQLSRTKNQREALFRSLVSSLVDKGEMETTLAKAKSIRSLVEKLITKAKTSSLNDRRVILKFLNKRALVNKLCDVIAPVFKEKQGGYTRIIRIDSRRGDQAEMAKLMFTESIPVEVKKEKKVKETKVVEVKEEEKKVNKIKEPKEKTSKQSK